MGWLVGIFFFFNIYYLHIDGNVKKKKISDLVKKIFLVAEKQVSWSAMLNKQFFIFGPNMFENLGTSYASLQK